MFYFGFLQFDLLDVAVLLLLQLDDGLFEVEVLVLVDGKHWEEVYTGTVHFDELCLVGAVGRIGSSDPGVFVGLLLDFERVESVFVGVLELVPAH